MADGRFLAERRAIHSHKDGATDSRLVGEKVFLRYRRPGIGMMEGAAGFSKEDKSMLVLTRRIGHAVHLQLTEDLPKGTTILVMLSDITSPNYARIGFTAPRSVSVVREELLTPEQKQG